MEDDKHIELAWIICNMIQKLNDLLWEHYEERFIEQQNQETIYRGSLKDHMGDEDF